ncbi:unnamed protein product [Calypogeia fissa]
MAAVSSRSHGGLPKPQRIANPFDSEDDEPTTSSTGTRSHVSNSSSSSAPASTRYTNPFDDDTKPHGHTKSKTVDNQRVAKSSNPFDDDDSPANSSSHVAKGNKIKSRHSSQSTGSHEASNPFNDDYEVTSKPKSRGDTILDDGSLFDDEPQTARPVKERKSTTRAFAAKIVEGGSRIKESASSSLSSVKLPTLPSSGGKGYGADEKTESKRIGKSTNQQSKDLFGEPEPGYVSTQNNYFSQQDQRNFSTQSVEELEQYAVKKSQDTTSSIKNAIRIAEDTKGVATTTLETLHDQGEQIRRTHETAVRVDEELGRGEKLLGSLGGLFTMTWKPKKAHKITGPQYDAEQYRRKNNLGERSALGLTGETPSRPRQQLSGMSSAQAQLEMEKNAQDDALSDLSNVLGDLKGMTLEMGHEIERQNGDLDRMHDDVHELNARVKGANNRTRHLLGR